jgi:hypothetical protein
LTINFRAGFWSLSRQAENSLSPLFLSRIMTQACEIGTLPSAQVVLSSHSASILGRVELEEISDFRLDRLDRLQRRAVVWAFTLPTDEFDARQYLRLAVRACRIADSKLTEIGDWDEAVLRDDIAGLVAEDFDLSWLGITDEDLNALLRDPDQVVARQAVAIGRLRSNAVMAKVGIDISDLGRNSYPGKDKLRHTA